LRDKRFVELIEVESVLEKAQIGILVVFQHLQKSFEHALKSAGEG
jgi:hypothetical protein